MLISPFSSIRKVVTHHAKIEFIKVFIENVLDSVNSIDKTNIPYLIIHGKKDELIPYSHSVELFQHVRNKG
jgi:fermentation-respiration switch protein FrsA (DUF1100 family)